MSARFDPAGRVLRVDVPAHKVHVPLEVPQHQFTVSVDDALETLPEDALLTAYLKKRGTEKPKGVKLMAPEKRRVIERAYLAAKRLADLPDEIKDLFWIVHGRALP